MTVSRRNSHPAPGSPGPRLRTRIAVTLLGPTLVAGHLLAFSASIDLAEFDRWRRLWNDLAIATADWIDARHGPAPPETPMHRGAAADDFALATIPRRIEREGLSPSRPLRVLRDGPFVRDRLVPAVSPHDDPGRSVLLGYGFRVVGGIAPFLIFWTSFLIGAPALAWACLELAVAGWPAAGLTLGLLVGLSPYFVETLALARYPVGFQLAAVLLAVALSVYSTLHPRPTAWGLTARVAVAAVGLGLCVFCRSSAALLFPAFVLPVVIAGARIFPDRGRRWAALIVGSMTFLAPVPLVARAQQNDFWQPIWEGLGDFDRTRGFTWSDAVAEAAARRGGAPGLFTPESERVFRSEVVGAVIEDPAWYARILAQRAASTLSLWKLLPMHAISGTPIRRSTAPNEGVMDKYWTYATTIDYVGFGSAQAELPLPLLWVPSLGLLTLCFAQQHLRRRARAAIRAVLPVAFGCLTLPVLITTAGGSEAQAIGIAYLLAAALLVDILTRRSRPGRIESRMSRPEEGGAGR